MYNYDLAEPLGLSGGVERCLVEDFLFLIESRLIMRAGANESSRSSITRTISSKG